jgi:hypothetical protein
MSDDKFKAGTFLIGLCDDCDTEPELFAWDFPGGGPFAARAEADSALTALTPERDERHALCIAQMTRVEPTKEERHPFPAARPRVVFVDPRH